MPRSKDRKDSPANGSAGLSSDRAIDAAKAWIRFRDAAAAFRSLEAPTPAADARIDSLFRQWLELFDQLTEAEVRWCMYQGAPSWQEAAGFIGAIDRAAEMLGP